MVRRQAIVMDRHASMLARRVLCYGRMVYAVYVTCTVKEFEWLSPTTIQIRFTSSKAFDFRPGQFISVVVPGDQKVKRCYSLASSPEDKSGYEICVKVVAGGRGSSYLASLKVGNTFKAFAPYGYFTLKSAPKKNIVLISTATGIAPFRSMAMSKAMREAGKVSLICGSRTENEILYPDLENLGFEVIRAVSQSAPTFTGFRGRVTDYLRQLPTSWHWHNTDFYICGNPEMVTEAKDILVSQRGVNPQSIFCELFAPAKPMANVVAMARPPKLRLATYFLKRQTG